MDFEEVPDGNERLRQAIKELWSNGRGPSASDLITLAQNYYQRRHSEGRIASIPDFPDPTTLTKFRSGVHKRLGIGFARAFWDYILNTQPDLLGMERPTDLTFINALFWYFGVDWRKHDTLMSQIRESTFLIYHFTEMLADRMPDAVVVGEITIGNPQSRLLSVSEKQAYDGRLGKAASRELNEGYCFPKFNSICMFMKGSRRHTPKFYVFHDYGFDENDKISWMTGRLARISEGKPLFLSDAYAVRVPKKHGETINIFPSSEMAAEIMAELRRN